MPSSPSRASAEQMQKLYERVVVQRWPVVLLSYLKTIIARCDSFVDLEAIKTRLGALDKERNELLKTIEALKVFKRSGCAGGGGSLTNAYRAAFIRHWYSRKGSGGEASKRPSSLRPPCTGKRWNGTARMRYGAVLAYS